MNGFLCSYLKLIYMAQIDYICENVNKVIKNCDSRNPFEICKEVDIHIHYKDLGSALKAYYFYQSRIKNIVINSRSGTIVRRILCAHELGHAVLHEKLAAMKGFQELELFDSLVPTEYEANLFAAELIIPDGEVLELLNDRDKSFFDIAKELYIPAELLDFKFRILKNKGYRIDAQYIAQSDFLKNNIPED